MSYNLKVLKSHILRRTSRTAVHIQRHRGESARTQVLVVTHCEAPHDIRTPSGCAGTGPVQTIVVVRERHQEKQRLCYRSD